MANFGADIIQNKTAMMQNENQNRRQMLLNLATQYQDRKQQDKMLAYKAANPDLTMDEQSLRDVQAYQAGRADPNILARLKARAAMEGNKTEYSQDALGNLVPRTTANPFAQLLSANDVGGSAQVPAVDAGQPVSAPMSKRDQLLSMLVPNENLPPDQFQNMVLTGDMMPSTEAEIAASLSNADKARFGEPPSMPPASDAYSQSPVGQKAVGDANINLTQDKNLERFKTDEQIRKNSATATTDTVKAASEAYARKTGENQAGIDAKVQPLKSIKSELDLMGEKVLKDAPSGKLETFANYVSSDVFGLPTKSAEALAELDVKLPYLQTQLKNFVRGAGEGTFTETDQNVISGMTFNKDDSAQTKVAKYNQLKSLVDRTIGGIENRDIPDTTKMLQAQAADAIAKGADPNIVNQRLQGLLNGK